MGKGLGPRADDIQVKGRRLLTVQEVNKHNKRDDKWLLIRGKAYDITNFAKRHPGGAKVISHYAGEDATDVWTAFHGDKDFVSKHLAPLYVGDVVDFKPSSLQEDFRALCEVVERNGWLQGDPLFFGLHLGLFVLLEVLAVAVLWAFGTGWLPWLTALLLFVVSQAQSGWSQHDYGHHNVFKSTKWNHIFHHLIIGFFKGASSHWWNFRHFQHHAKPNRLGKDPDTHMAFLFLLGDQLPREWGAKRKGFMPYHLQHAYFFLLGPPLLIPIYVHYENLYFCIKRRDYVDIVLGASFFVRLFAIFSPFLGTWGTLTFYMLARMLESHWFVWCTQMSHLPNQVQRDPRHEDWVHLQLRGTCNVQPGPFVDWFCGHLNYQIEHHLFPLMPRHHFHKVVPLVRSLCEKHGIEYRCKPLFTAWADIVRSLQRSGEIWYEAYYNRSH
ncbi:acyl-CoA Delta-6 desaturase-like [Babylonia areolata]|uniref:acyl-CoA Delta-6 desaturase-like n=1 Tax=Babylonia areolata TaxID=304850 RepID=UPI003FD23954